MSDVEEDGLQGRLTAEEMDEKRKEQIAYEYLCRLEEAKIWIEACIGEKLPPTVELEESLRNGVILAKLGHFISPDQVPFKRIFDQDLSKYERRGLQFRHTDNINHWLKSLKSIGLPEIFYPETTDIYDRKNIPRLIYCLHALSLYMFKIDRAPQIQDLYGKIQFTDEEINNMKKELDKYGITMPSFSKIGGILANEMPVDEAALHAAIIAINTALENGDVISTMDALKNPAAYINNIQDELAVDYQQVLFDSKSIKSNNFLNKTLSGDIYDELLTQVEIQSSINEINEQVFLVEISRILKICDVPGLMSIFKKCHLFTNVNDNLAGAYMQKLLKLNANEPNSTGDEILGKEDVQQAINFVNENEKVFATTHLVLSKINKALEGMNPGETFDLLQNPLLQFPSVSPTAKCLYHEELKSMKDEKKCDLNLEDITKGLWILNAIAEVNKAVDNGDSHNLMKSLTNEDAHINDVDIDVIEKYLKFLTRAKKLKVDELCKSLTHYDVQKCINDVNYKVALEHDRIEAVAHINEAVDENNVEELLRCLNIPHSGIKDVCQDDGHHYLQLLKQLKYQKSQETDDPAAVLWYEEIQNCINIGNRDTHEAQKLSTCVAAVNISAEEEDAVSLLNCLRQPCMQINSVNNQLVEAYISCLKDFRCQKERKGKSGSGWMMNKLKEGSKFFFNVYSMKGMWKKEDSVVKDFSLLTRDDIENCIKEVNHSSTRHSLFEANKDYIIILQAFIRGNLARKKYLARKQELWSKSPAAKAIQIWWRKVQKKKASQRRFEYYRENIESVIMAQTFLRGYIARKAYLNRLNYYKMHEASIVKIQAFMKTAWAKQDYKALTQGENPSVSVIRKFVHLLDITDQDYDEEIELDKLKQKVVQDIRCNKQLDHELAQMDIKIGLLVKNRISLQDVISHSKFLGQYNSSSSSLNTASQQGGLRGLNKADHDRLEAYQHLFYLLQTQPNYIAKLMFQLPQTKTTKFMESAVLSLYNYASNQRDEYMLLGLFKTALEEEIRSKVTAPSDIITGNPMVVKMIVSFNRNSRGQVMLRELLRPLVNSIIEDKELNMNTNVVDVYKQWINQIEAQSGKASGLPYETSLEQALSHKEVCSILEKTVSVLQNATEKFFSAILSSIDKIPYGMRYMAKVMKNALYERFPNAQEKEILKIIGNLIYYRYINSAIVAPDAFDIIEVAASSGLTNEQRRNLGSIAKILQFAASNKGFGSDSPHLVSMNSYIIEAHARFKKYFNEICEVEEPEVIFNIDQYSDVARITKPVIYISIGEIVEMHKLLLEHQQTIAPDPKDPLHELLADLGDVCDIGTILGDSDMDDIYKAQMSKVEVSLTLSNKFEIPSDDQMNIKSTLLKTKQMIIDILRCQKSGDTLVQVLQSKATEDEENVHVALVKARDRADIKTPKSKLIHQQSLASGIRLPLDSMKEVVIENLVKLEQARLVSKANGYQDIITSIVKDVRNQRIHRQRRKVEMAKLKLTIQSLAQKRTFFEEQINYYNQYVKTCLDNQTAKTKKYKSNSKISVKYSAAKLHEKGILLGIDNLQTNQFKNVLFEIVSTDLPGLFIVHAKFMGVNMEKVEIKFQDLLELQYQGIAVMKMFDKAQVNVNLLIYLLNHKFYAVSVLLKRPQTTSCLAYCILFCLLWFLIAVVLPIALS